MKKTLLSIITMATLVGSMAAYSAPMEKEITVSATINGVMDLTDENGKGIDALNLEYDAIGKKHSLTLPIKITSNTGNKVNVIVKEELVLAEKDNTDKVFSGVEVKLGDEVLSVNKAQDFSLTSTAFETDLSITAEQPSDAVSGEFYTGALKLSIEAGV
ncbi:CS1 type fimbrial major subunit [Yersinia alsatica]|uniref:CS1 type fimbrial major subunit n=1 Tax=Yersinia alsatica TaxID=2890317 RepID=UPI0011AAD1D9|nr:CS1 type fimbrial major subunit [Yersinia alsatica]